MTKNAFVASCDICKKEAAPAWNDAGSIKVLCTDCYLKSNGFDPEKTAKRFGDFANQILAEGIQTSLDRRFTESEDEITEIALNKLGERVLRANYPCER